MAEVGVIEVGSLASWLTFDAGIARLQRPA